MVYYLFLYCASLRGCMKFGLSVLWIWNNFCKICKNMFLSSLPVEGICCMGNAMNKMGWWYKRYNTLLDGELFPDHELKWERGDSDQTYKVAQFLTLSDTCCLGEMVLSISNFLHLALVCSVSCSLWLHVALEVSTLYSIRGWCCSKGLRTIKKQTSWKPWWFGFQLVYYAVVWGL